MCIQDVNICKSIMYIVIVYGIISEIKLRIKIEKERLPIRSFNTEWNAYIHLLDMET